MAKRKFKTESKRILDLMVNSIYTHKEIFLRELISNASDAIDKLYFKLLSESGGRNRGEFSIGLAFDKAARTLTVSDNGIGMTESELENNLGTIAKSGSLDFKSENEMPDDVDIIGQFGVGFYSAFMVAKKVEVISRAHGDAQAHRWVSDGSDGYTVEPCEKDGDGSTVILTLKDDTENENYSEFLDQYRLSNIVKRYSDYIRYPIVMNMSRSKLKEGTESEYETVTEPETLNSMVPLWRKNKSEVTDEEYAEFYKTKFSDYEKPMRVIHQKTEGSATFSAVLFIPSRAPYDFYTREYEKGLQLYSSGVMITEKCAELLPDHFSFVKGIVDSEDLALNISREMLQHDRQLKLIETTLEKRIKKELADMLANERESYEEFWKNFGLQIKYGVYAGFGANSEELKDLLLFRSARDEKLVTLAEYVADMPAEQKFIYYAAGNKQTDLAKLPAAELVLDKGYDLLLLTDEVDEFALNMLHAYSEKEFKSVTSGDLELESEEEKAKSEAAQKQGEPMFAAMKDALGDSVTSVRASSRLKSYPVCFATDGGVSIEMERVLNAMPNGEKIKANKVLEVNPEHPIYSTLKALFDKGDTGKLAVYSKLLYNQARLIEGLAVDDPVEFCNDICGLM